MQVHALLPKGITSIHGVLPIVAVHTAECNHCQKEGREVEAGVEGVRRKWMTGVHHCQDISNLLVTGISLLEQR